MWRRVASIQSSPFQQEPREEVDRSELLDVVQFDTAIYYANEVEGGLKADILRFGMMEIECRVDYTTEDAYQVKTYDGSKKFLPVSGQLVFKPGEVFKTIEVPIIEDDRWEPMLEFKIRLSNPVNCRLGRYLFVARCKVIDNDYFPTNRLGKQLESTDEEDVHLEGNASDLELMLEYFKLNYEFAGVGWRTRAALAIDQLQNIYFLLTTYLVTYITDDILGPNPEVNLLIPGNRDLTLALVGALYIVPYVLLYLLDQYKTELRIAEISRSALQENIFATYLNWGENTRKSVPPGQVTLAVTKDAAEIVETGYMKLFEVAKNLGRLTVSAGFIIAENPDALFLLILFSAAIATFLALRYRETVALIEEASSCEESIVDVVQESLTNYRLIRDYFLRPQIQQTLQINIDRLNDAAVLVALRGVARDYFPGGLSTLLLAAYIPLGGEAVINGSMQIGVFLATVNLFKEIGSSYSQILNSLLDITKAIEPITKVTNLMNLRSSLPRMKDCTEQRRQATREARSPQRLAELRRNLKMRFGSDAIPIELRHVSYGYKDNPSSIFKDVCISVPQGRLVGVVGRRRRGKSTLMKLLGQVIQPTSGEIFVPSYLRILHVSSTPMILKGSLWDNIAVGQAYWNNREFQVERALRICRRCHFTPNLIDTLLRTKDEFLKGPTNINDGGAWRRELTQTDLMLITLARAFIYDPAVMVLNRPTSPLPFCMANEVVNLLREFVDNRGLEIPLSPEECVTQRRPRTALASFVRSAEMDGCDVIWACEDHSVFQVSREDVSRYVEPDSFFPD